MKKARAHRRIVIKACFQPDELPSALVTTPTNAQVETYGTCTAVLVPYFAVIQAADLRSYF